MKMFTKTIQVSMLAMLFWGGASTGALADIPGQVGPYKVSLTTEPSEIASVDPTPKSPEVRENLEVMARRGM